jgi:hypothetical protein
VHAPLDRIYMGNRGDSGGPGTVLVTDPGSTTTYLDPRYDLRNHSPTGFQWGYGGSGPAQLALALLADALNDDERATRHYQTFKAARIASIAGDTWEMTAGEILAEVERYEEADACQP